jgi:diguanylate cyclase (GGDEF)-like protein
MSTPALPVLGLPSRLHGAALAALAALTALLYAWPLVDGGDTSGFTGVDRLLQLAAATALGVAALVVSWRTAGRDRHALVALAGAAETWACVQAVQLGLQLTGPGDPPGWLAATGAVVLGAGVGAALWLLRRPGSGRRPARPALEWALLAVSLLVLQLSLWPAASDGLLGALRCAAAALLGAAGLLTLLRPSALSRTWPLVPTGVVLAALGLASVGALGGADPVLASRLPGAVFTAGLAAGALGLLLGGAVREPTAAREPARRALAPALVLCVLPLAALGVVGLLLAVGERPEPLPLAGAALIGLLGYGRLHLLAAEARAQTRELAEVETGLRHRAFHDELTGLANRALFMDRLARALDVHRRHRLPLSVLYGDLDGFKLVNDAHGHAAGDELLVAVAERFRACLRPEDTLARLGGDEFVLLLEHGSDPQVVASRLAEALHDPFSTSAGSFRLSMSTGIAQVEPEAPTPSPQQLVARADAQMYGVKQRARASAVRPPALPQQDRLSAEPDATLAAALASDLHEGKVHVVYQPVVDARTGDVSGLEALARWTHDGHALPPSRFVDLAERFGLSGTLTDAVLDQACAQLRIWSDAVGHARLTMAVNVSPSQLADLTLGDRVRTALTKHRLEPGQLVLETTVDAIAAHGGRLSPDGAAVPLSVGGFTGGPGDFALLKSLPVRSIKLDGRPRDAAGAVEGERLLRVLVALGRELDLRVVVERVERTEELIPLRSMTGVLAQGNLLSRPAEPGVLDDVVRHGCPLPS